MEVHPSFVIIAFHDIADGRMGNVVVTVCRAFGVCAAATVEPSYIISKWVVLLRHGYVHGVKCTFCRLRAMRNWSSSMSLYEVCACRRDSAAVIRVTPD